jgi:hypothetical protein
VPDRVVSHLLGEDHVDILGLTSADAEADAVAWTPPDALCRPLAGALRRGVRLVYLWQPRDGTGVLVARAALAAVGRPALHFSVDRLKPETDVEELARQVAREAALQEAGVIITGLDAQPDQMADALAAINGLRIPILVVGTNGWNPDCSEEIPLMFEASELSPGERDSLVRVCLGEALEDGVPEPDEQVLALGQFSVGPRQVVRAAHSALLQSGLNGGRVSHADLHLAVRRQNNTGLERLARRISAEVEWTDLVLPPAQLEQLHELADRARYRELVLRTWGMRRGGGRGRGVTALFAGDSGTGKTMSAEVLAGELGLDLYAVDLSTVVDKYVGETEKNLERIFTEATQVNGVLLFDEADAIFGKRSEVRDAHDRYANIESAYLLQRMEAFEGLAVLSTNLRANLDEAFTRRLDIVVDFPAPDEEHRLRLWQRSLGEPLPVGEDLDLEFCAKAFELSGGNIRSAATSAAYRAARRGRRVAMADVIQGIVSEYRKLGRLCQEREFGPYQHLLTTAGE